MSSEKSSRPNTSLYATPPSKKTSTPKSITRKPSLVNFTKKKPTEISQIRSSDRIRFISPTKANLFVTQESLNIQNSLEFNYTQYSSNQPINYPFIKQCASPKCFENILSSRKTSFCDKKVIQQNSFIRTFLQPSIEDFSNCELVSDINNISVLHQKISDLKKINFELNLLLDDKNQFMEKQKQDYESKLAELFSELLEIKKGIQTSSKKIFLTQDKMLHYQSRSKQLQQKLSQTTEKLDKADKEIKMYKAKFKVNYTSGKDKQKDDVKCRKYHQNCCKAQHHTKDTKGIKNQQNNYIKQNILKDSKKTNIIEVSSLKKIKSQKILTACSITSIEPSPQASRLMKIHSNQEQFNEYIELKAQIETLSTQIRYKDIEILTLKKTKCDFEKQKLNYEKVKTFNKKLLARVQFLTRECDGLEMKKRHSLPLQMTPKKKFSVMYEDFDQQDDEKQAYDTVQLQLSPEKNFKDTQTMAVMGFDGIRVE